MKRTIVRRRAGRKVAVPAGKDGKPAEVRIDEVSQ